LREDLQKFEVGMIEKPTVRLNGGKEVVFYSREYVGIRLKDAGRTLMRTPATGTKPQGHKSNWPEIVREAQEAYGYTEEKPIWGRPTMAQITRMEEVMDWLLLIENPKTRSIVIARMLTHPLDDTPILSWRRLGRKINKNYQTVRNWYFEGVSEMTKKINHNSSLTNLTK